MKVLRSPGEAVSYGNPAQGTVEQEFREQLEVGSFGDVMGAINIDAARFVRGVVFSTNIRHGSDSKRCVPNYHTVFMIQTYTK